MSKFPKTYADAPAEIREAVEGLIRTYGSDPALLAGALVAATTRIIMAATLAEREACAAVAEDHFDDDGTGPDCQGCGEVIAERIRKREET